MTMLSSQQHPKNLVAPVLRLRYNLAMQSINTRAIVPVLLMMRGIKKSFAVLCTFVR
jgi:hypothetical protein